MSFSDQLHVVVQLREPLDKEEWMRKVAKVLFSNNGRHTMDAKGTQEVNEAL